MTQLFLPHISLKPYVSAYLVVSHHFDQPFEHTFSARGVPMLIFPFRQPSSTTYQYAVSGKAYPKPIIDEPALLHTATEHARSTFVGDINFVMVMMKPTAAHHLLRSGIKGLANRVDVLDNFSLPPFFGHLQDQLWQVQEPRDAVKRIDYQLCQYFIQHVSLHNQDVSPVIDHMLRKEAMLSVRDLAMKFRCSERWLEKQVLLQTGATPKTWLRLIRFRAASNWLLQKPNTSWMELVAKYDYTDQSHLIRDFKHFSGSTPAYHFKHHGEHEASFNQHRVGLITNIER